MLKREKLEAMLRDIGDAEFAAIWKRTYGSPPRGDRADLVTDFVADQYDMELDGCIALVESSLGPVPKPKKKPANKWLPPR